MTTCDNNLHSVVLIVHVTGGLAFRQMTEVLGSAEERHCFSI